jgi:predicted AAA+ superfamily ATPase
MMEPGVAVAVHNGDIRTNKGAIAENPTAEELSKNGIMLTYFEKKSNPEVDFILNPEGTVTAPEVKSGNNMKAKSPESVMSERYGAERGIKLERTNIYTDEKDTEHYPLFAAAFLFRTDIDKPLSRSRRNGDVYLP